MDLNFHYMYRRSLFCLKLTGVHPYIKRNLLWGIHFFGVYVPIIFANYMFFYSIFFFDIHGEINILCGNGSWFIVSFVITFKNFVMWMYQSEFQTLIETVQKDFRNASTLTPKEQKVVKYYATKALYTELYFLGICISGVGLFIVQPMIYMTYLSIKGEFRYIPVLELTIPFEDRENLIYYQFGSFVLTCYFGLYALATYSGVTPLGMIFILHACGRLELLKMKVLNLFPVDIVIDRAERHARLKAIILEIQRIFDFVDMTKTTMKYMYEMTLKMTAVLLPFVAYVCIEQLKKGVIITTIPFIIVLCGTAAISSFPCICGDLLQERGEELREAIYSSNWELFWEREIRTSIIIIMTKMQETIAIRSVYRVICLQTLTDVFSSAYSLFNLLNAAFN